MITAKHLAFAPTFSEHDYKYTGVHPIHFPRKILHGLQTTPMTPPILFRGLHYYEFYSRSTLEKMGGAAWTGKEYKSAEGPAMVTARDFLGACESGLGSRCICSHSLTSTGEKCTNTSYSIPMPSHVYGFPPPHHN